MHVSLTSNVHLHCCFPQTIVSLSPENENCCLKQGSIWSCKFSHGHVLNASIAVKEGGDEMVLFDQPKCFCMKFKMFPFHYSVTHFGVSSCEASNWLRPKSDTFSKYCLCIQNSFVIFIHRIQNSYAQQFWYILKTVSSV